MMNKPRTTTGASRSELGGLIVILGTSAVLAIYIIGSLLADQNGEADETSPGFRVRINTATLAEIQLLPGFGPELAARIIEHRDRNGPFQKPEELLAVHGVGPARLSQITQYLVLDTPPTEQLVARN